MVFLSTVDGVDELLAVPDGQDLPGAGGELVARLLGRLGGVDVLRTVVGRSKTFFLKIIPVTN